MLVVPIDSTLISLQQCQPRKRGKLVRKNHRRHPRLKANRSSYNNLRKYQPGGTTSLVRPVPTLSRSRSFHNRKRLAIIKVPNRS